MSVWWEGKDAQTHMSTIPWSHTNNHRREIILLCVHTDCFFNILTNTYATKQKALLSPTDGASMGEGRKWAEAAAAAGVRMGK